MTAEATKAKEERVTRLSGAVARTKARAGLIDAPRLLMLGGAVLMPLGLALIGVAWYGAAHTPFLFEQVPYLISGGLLGLGVSIVGGFLYFAYWITALIRDQRVQSRRLASALERIAAGNEGVNESSASPNGEYVTTEKGTMFHRPDCTVVADRTDLRPVTADTKLRPCKICDPLGAK